MYKASQTTQGLISTLKDAAQSKIGELFSSISEKIKELLPNVISFIENIDTDEIVTGVENLMQTFNDLLPVITGVTAATVAYKTATSIAGIIDALRKATEGQTLAQTLLNAVMNANPFVLIATLIAGLVAAVITLWNTNEGFRNAVISAWEAIKETATSVFTAVASFFTETIPNAFQSMVEWIREGISSFISIGSEILTGIYNGIVGSVQNLYEAAKTIILTLAENIIGAENLEKLISLGGELINALSEGIENVVAELVSVGEKVVESIKSGISSAWEGLKTWFNNLWDSLFKNRTVDVDVNASGGGSTYSNANGISYVPYDGYYSVLHEGERVLTAEENKAYNRGATGNTSGITIIQNIQAVPQTPVEFAAATEAYFEQARWAFA
jgi:phage-related protein